MTFIEVSLRSHDPRIPVLRSCYSRGIISERLGHSGIAITLDIYSHVLPGLQEEAARRFDEVMQEARVQSEIEQIAKQRYEKS